MISYASCLLFTLKPFSFNRAIDVRSKLSEQSINKYDANVFPYKTPMAMSKKSVSQSGE